MANKPVDFISLLLSNIRAFLLALSFLSRLAPGRRASYTEMAQSVIYYPPAGIIIAVILVFPYEIGLFSGFPFVQAWSYVFFSAWLTRALHLDGLADVLDALGSGKTGGAFHDVLKDSRIGVFGVVGLVFVLSGQIICAASLFDYDRISPLFFAPLFGRCLPILLACVAQPSSQASLGAMLASTPKRLAAALAVFCMCIGGFFCLSYASFAITLLLTFFILLMLYRLALREGGYSGDFFGFAIVAGESAVLLAALF